MEKGNPCFAVGKIHQRNLSMYSGCVCRKAVLLSKKSNFCAKNTDFPGKKSIFLLKNSIFLTILPLSCTHLILTRRIDTFPFAYGDPLKHGYLNGHALCTYFVGKYGRSFKHSTLKCFRRVTNPKLIRELLRLQVSRALPWYFPPINQSCLLPRLRSPFTNPSTVKPPLSFQWMPAPQCRLLGGISSLLAPSPPHDKQQDIGEGRVLGVN
jgi:hypothetical protein